MNIIQIQDRLKGLPEEALVKYVEQPMGEAPIYLVLGELQRRNEMKKRFQATQAEKPSVAEQLVAEAKPMQMGLGAMAPQRMMPGSEGVGAPQPAPEIDPRQLAASGIAANPVKNVGQYAKGGIVGYQTGGNIGNIDMSDFEYGFNPYTQMKGYAGDAAGAMGRGFFGAEKFLPFGKGFRQKFDPITNEPIGTAGRYPTRNKQIIDDEKAKAELAELMQKEGLPMETDAQKEARLKAEEKYKRERNLLDDKKTEIEKEEVKKEELKVEEDGVIPDLSADDKVRADLARIKNLLPEDKDTIDLRERLADREDRALNMALIRGGLGMAAGQSANFLDNLAAGATSGVESYAKTQEDILEAQRELAKQKRAEDLALLGKALDMEEGGLDRISRERVAEIMSSPNSGKLIDAVLKDGKMKQIQSALFGFENTPENERTDAMRKQIENLKAQERIRLNELIQLNRGNISGLTPSGTVDTSGLTQRQKELLDLHSGK